MSRIDGGCGKPGGDREEIVELRLYVAGATPHSQEALANLKAICRQYFPSRHRIEVVDVLTEPKHVLSGSILVTPTLVKVSPPPVQLVVGNLSDRATVLHALGLSPGSSQDALDGEEAR